MRHVSRRLAYCSVVVVVAAALPCDLLPAQQTTSEPIADFGGGWSDHWMHVELDSRATRFLAVREGGEPVLRADADRSASAMLHELDDEPLAGATVSWRWKIDRAVPDNRHEREKKGDDYAARLFVIFDAEPFSRDARALCYVWASTEPVGSSFENPYISNVATIVLQSGDGRAGVWVDEKRRFIADYEAAFGEPPGRLTGIAVMVDTDDTKTSATAWFGDVSFNSASGAASTSQRR